MFILENALISITRNKGRNILIGIIILVISLACTISLAINNTADDLINSYESAYDKELTISFDKKNMMNDADLSDESSREEIKEKMQNVASLTISQIDELAKSDHINSYYYTYSFSLNGNNLEKAEMNIEDSSNDGKKDFSQKGGDEKFSENKMDFTLIGYSSIEAMSEFIDGTYTMSEVEEDAWDKAFEGNYVFINSELASYNSLSLGDAIILEDESGNTYSFEIIGIYEESETTTSEISMFSGSANTIITSSTSLATIDESNDSITGNISPTFIIDDYENSDSIQEQFYEKGLDESYVVQTNEDVANSGLNGISNVKSFANTFLIITLLIGGVVLIVINMINIRERKYEIGVLRTIGISKLKLTIQFVAELLMVTIVALFVGASIGALSAKPISNSLLSSEIKSSESNNNSISKNFNPNSDVKDNDSKKDSKMPSLNNASFNGIAQISAYESIDAVVNFKVIFELLGICLFLVLLSSVSAMISIQRFSPLTILKERS